jgi:DNA-binding transcriptional LysR family regulator
MDLDLRRARHFQTVALELNFGRAAVRLHITQPALSRQVAALERELGVQLIDRGSHPISLTRSGKTFLDAIGPVIAAADDAIRQIRQQERGADALVVGFMPGLSPTHAMRRVISRHPEARIEIREVNWRNQAESVLDGTVDVALVRTPFDERGLSIRTVVNDPRGVLLSAEHPLAGTKVISISALAEDPAIRHRFGGPWDDYWTVNPRPDGRTPKSGPMVETIPEKLAVVASGSAVTFIPQSAARSYSAPGVVWVPISDIDDSQVALAWVGGRLNALGTAFADAISSAPTQVITPSDGADRPGGAADVA